MSCLRRFLAAGALLAACISGAQAQVYVAGGFGADWMRRSRAETNNGDGGHFTFETGWLANAAIGYRLANGLRLEGEYAFRRNALDKSDGESGGGGLSAQTLLANVIYDIGTWDVGLGLKLTPYAGAGGGMARVRGTDFVVPDNVAITGATYVAAWQMLAGVSVPVADRLSLDFGYRQMQTEIPEFSVRTPDSGRIRSATVPYRHQVLLLTLRYEFGHRE